MKQEKIQLTPEEEIQNIIDKAKKKYGRVYKTILADEVIIWRMLKRSEYKEVMNMVAYREEAAIDENGNEIINQVQDDELTYDLRQEEIAKRVILYPAGIVENMAAVADIISTECMIKSGFGEAPTTEQC
jgi:hypothetical protein